jgi:hypothetical protein
LSDRRVTCGDDGYHRSAEKQTGTNGNLHD